MMWCKLMTDLYNWGRMLSKFIIQLWEMLMMKTLISAKSRGRYMDYGAVDADICLFLLLLILN
jgi:hypothetical protein